MLDDVVALLRAHLDAEARAGFPRLTRMPSSQVVRFLDYFATLGGADRDAVLSVLAEIDALKLVPSPAARDRLLRLVDANPAFVGYRNALQSPPFTMGLRYVGLRMLKAMLADRMSVDMMAQTRATLDFVPRDDLPATLVPDPDLARVAPAKAPLLRTLIDGAFLELFATGKQKREGGETEYAGALQGTNIKVSVDFAARGLQLAYGVKIPDETKTVFVWGLTYEELWAAGRGWDCLTEENAERSIRLLCDHIVQIVSLRNGAFGLLRRGT